MTGEELLKKYPTATKAIIEFLTEELIESCKSTEIPEEYKAYVLERGIESSMVCAVIDRNPRLMFDALDAHGIFCEIACAVHSFGVKVYSKIEMHPYLENIPTRKEADRHAIELGFSILEKQLIVTQE
jgi:hypothetical protein